MEFRDLLNQAKTVRDKYTILSRTEGFKTWGPKEHTQGLVGDVGDLMKLVMAKEGYWIQDADIDTKLKHELADCLYSILIISDELGINLEQEFLKTMNELKGRISEREVILNNDEETK